VGKGWGVSDNGAGHAVPLGAITVVVQQRQRFFREGLALLLEAEPGIALLGTAVSATELIKLCAHRPPHVAIVEVDDPVADPCRTAATLRSAHYAIRFVGVLGSDEAGVAAQRCFPAPVCRADGIGGIVDAVRAAPRRPLAPITVADEADGAHALTGRERDVLALVGAGCTTREISDRLSISRKTVENHKQHIFSKLQVRNQAHAVAVAMRAGLITVDGVLDLAVPRP
jgi:DNA-binding NarL/FixJ family response regulator